MDVKDGFKCKPRPRLLKWIVLGLSIWFTVCLFVATFAHAEQTTFSDQVVLSRYAYSPYTAQAFQPLGQGVFFTRSGSVSIMMSSTYGYVPNLGVYCFTSSSYLTPTPCDGVAGHATSYYGHFDSGYDTSGTATLHVFSFATTTLSSSVYVALYGGGAAKIYGACGATPSLSWGVQMWGYSYWSSACAGSVGQMFFTGIAAGDVPPVITAVVPLSGSVNLGTVAPSMSYSNPAGSNYSVLQMKIYDEYQTYDPVTGTAYEPLVYVATSSAQSGAGVYTWTPTTTLSLATSTYREVVTIVPQNLLYYQISSSTEWATQWQPPSIYSSPTSSVQVPWNTYFSSSTMVLDASSSAIWSSPVLQFFNLPNLLLSRWPFSWIAPLTASLFKLTMAAFSLQGFDPVSVTLPPNVLRPATSTIQVFGTSTIAYFYKDEYRLQFRVIAAFCLWIGAAVTWWRDILQLLGVLAGMLAGVLER